MPRGPRISVCMPAYNQGAFIAAAVESVLRQARVDWELVVCDDASTDATKEVLDDFSDDRRIRYLRHHRNLGVAASRNSCLAAARGEYIAWLDSDDVYEPDMLETQAGVLDRHPEVGLVHGAFKVIDSEGLPLPDWRLPSEGDTVQRGAEAFRELLLENYIAAPTVLVRRASHERAGAYSVGRRTESSTDWEMWLRIALIADVAYTHRVVAAYRQHKGSISSRTTAGGVRLRCDAAVARRILARPLPLPDRRAVERRARVALAVRAVCTAYDSFDLGDRRRALAALAIAARASPRHLVGGSGCRLAASLARGDELGAYRSSKRVLGRLYEELVPSRFAERIRKVATTDPDWDAMVHQTARTIGQVTPRAARVAVVDKHDPTILELSDRTGWHFPDRSLLPDGYPRDSDAAVRHLEQLRDRGATHLVFPSASFWWLGFYDGLSRHLESTYRPLCREDHCVIYDIAEQGSGEAVGWRHRT